MLHKYFNFMTCLSCIKRSVGVTKKRGSPPLTEGDVYSLQMGGRVAKKEGKKMCYCNQAVPSAIDCIHKTV